ncbi:MAG: toxin-antitoxin system HicB family antitoxin [Oscillospiraceae bacterium]|nr:toxin-antitoxin system HicB family antitoxin [Oscillospiraceae bacterium]
MSNLLEYMGYYGTVEFSAPDNVLFGEVLGIEGLISYHGKSIDELRENFVSAIDDYLEMCENENMTPQKPHKTQSDIWIELCSPATTPKHQP